MGGGPRKKNQVNLSRPEMAVDRIATCPAQPSSSYSTAAATLRPLPRDYQRDLQIVPQSRATFASMVSSGPKPSEEV